MNNKFLKASLISCSVLALAACGGGGGGNGTSDSNGLEEFFTGPGTFDSSQPVSAGAVDLSTYVAVGDSLTAGFADGSLYFDGQINSYPNILAQSFAQADGGIFNQPLVNDNLGGLLIGGAPQALFQSRLVLAGSSPSPARQSEELMVGVPTTEVLGIVPGSGALTGDGPFNNLGVPGARVTQIDLPGFGDAAGLPNANPFYVRFNQVPGTGIGTPGAGESLLDAATGQTPTFFSLWIGNNDVLDFGTSGGVVEANDGLEQGTGAQQITPVPTFTLLYNNIVSGLTAGGADGVLVNIPAIQDIPFFTTVPFNAITLDSATATTVNAGFATYNGGLQAALGAGLITAEEAAARTINFVAGSNGILILDEGLTSIVLPGPTPLPNLRQATADDAILLTSLGALGTQLVGGDPATTVGVAIPLGVTSVNPADLFDPAQIAAADAAVLTEREIQLIADATAAYNSVIEDLAANNSNLVLYDAAADLASVNEGILLSSTSNLSSDFISGGGFSLDGVHPTATGYSVVANGILRAMNIGFGSNLPFDDSQQRTRVFFEFSADTDFSVP